jgi:two-component system response regulator YesN
MGICSLFLVLPTLITGIVSYSLSSRLLLEQAEHTSLSLVENASRAFDQVFQDVDTLTIMLEYLPWLRNIAQLSEHNALRSELYGPNDILKIIAVLRTYRIRYPAVKEIAVFIKNSDIVIDCEGTYSTDEYFGSRYSIYSPETGTLNKADWNTAQVFLPDARVRKYAGALMERLLIGRKLPSWSPTPREAVLFQLDKEYLATILEQFRASQGMSLSVVDVQNRLVEGIGEINTGLVQKILSSGSTGTGQITWDGRAYAYCVIRAQSHDLRYVAVTTMAELLTLANQVRRATLYLTAGVLFLGLLLVYSTTRRSFIPIRNLAQRLPVFDGVDHGGKDELTRITDAFFVMSSKQAELHERVREFLPVVRDATLGKLLIASEGDRVQPSELESCSIRFPLQRIAVAILAVRSLVGQLQPRFSLIETGIWTLMRQDIQDHFAASRDTCYVLERVPMQYYIILNTDLDSTAELKSIFARLVVTLETRLTDMAPLGVMAAVGELHNRIEDIAQAFQESKKALDGRFAAPDETVILYSDLADSVRDEFTFDMESRHKLSSVLTEGNPQRIDDFIENLLNSSIMESRINTRGPYALLELLLHTVQDIKEVDPRLAQSISFNELATLQNDTERINFCRATFQRIAIAISGKPCASNEVMTRIVEFVDQNFHDPGLSLTALSERFGLSAIYISRLFKHKTGCNFLDYLNRKRIERAKELLISPHAMVKSVSGTAGFSSEVSFRRVFRKYEAMSPGAFRRRTILEESSRIQT